MKSILLTGASKGIGKACAKRFAKAGYHLILTARRYEKLAALQTELNCSSEIHVMDVTDRSHVKKTVDAIASKSPIDILINNAGLALGLEPAQKASWEDWETMIDTNIKGLAACTHAVLPHMVARNQGHILNLGSIAGNWPYPCGNVYGATKAFVKQFSLNLRADLLGTRVRVTCIEPGLTGQTEFSLVRFKGDESRTKALYSQTTALTPEDVAEALFWCVEQPEHVNVNSIEIMPTGQAFSPLALKPI